MSVGVLGTLFIAGSGPESVAPIGEVVEYVGFNSENLTVTRDELRSSDVGCGSLLMVSTQIAPPILRYTNVTLPYNVATYSWGVDWSTFKVDHPLITQHEPLQKMDSLDSRDDVVSIAENLIDRPEEVQALVYLLLNRAGMTLTRAEQVLRKKGWWL